MRTRRCLILLVVIAMLAPVSACSSCGETPPSPETRSEAPAQPATLETQTFRLANGLAAEVVSGPCGETAAVVVLFAVGADHDPPGRSGMSHVVQRLLTGPGGGGERVASTGVDHTVWSSVVATDRVPAELTAVAARMARPELTEDGLAAARAEVLDELSRRQGGDAALTAQSYAAESLRPSRDGGLAAEVEAITLAEVDAFWRAHHQPGNARVVVVGGIDPASTRARIEATFSPLPAGTPATPREPSSATVTGTLVMGDAPSALAVAVPAPAPSEPSFPAFLVLAARLLASPAEARSWSASYDPVADPDALFLTAPIQPGEPAEPLAARVRVEAETLLARPLSADDARAATERFGLVLGSREHELAACTEDPRALALARARRAQLALGELPLADALGALTQEQLDEAAARFGARRSAAVVAGGAIR